VTHNWSFWSLIFSGSQLHCYWQPNSSKRGNTQNTE